MSTTEADVVARLTRIADDPAEVPSARDTARRLLDHKAAVDDGTADVETWLRWTLNRDLLIATDAALDEWIRDAVIGTSDEPAPMLGLFDTPGVETHQ
jgi:hypothetical protein